MYKAKIKLFMTLFSYVLLHHVMGELDGNKGAWAYVEGGMGGVSQAIANCAEDRGAHIFCNKVH